MKLNGRLAIDTLTFAGVPADASIPCAKATSSVVDELTAPTASISAPTDELSEPIEALLDPEEKAAVLKKMSFARPDSSGIPLPEPSRPGAGMANAEKSIARKRIIIFTFILSFPY
jgi:hypothetical protein